MPLMSNVRCHTRNGAGVWREMQIRVGSSSLRSAAMLVGADRLSRQASWLARVRQMLSAVHGSSVEFYCSFTPVQGCGKRGALSAVRKYGSRTHAPAGVVSQACWCVQASGVFVPVAARRLRARPMQRRRCLASSGEAPAFRPVPRGCGARRGVKYIPWVRLHLTTPSSGQPSAAAHVDVRRRNESD
jgi:hypothetical protein